MSCKACARLLLVGVICGLGLFGLAGCAGQSAEEEKWGISDADYHQNFDESMLARQQPFTRTELTRIISDGAFAVAQTESNENPQAAFNFLLEHRNWDEDRLNYILVKISYIAAQLTGKTFSPGEARFYAALNPTPQEAGIVKTHLKALLKLLPHFSR